MAGKDDKRVVQLVTASKPVEYGQTEEYLSRRNAQIDEIVSGKKKHIIIVVEDSGPTSYITDMDMADANFVLDLIKTDILLGVMDGDA